MPEHFHLLLPPQPAESTSRILQELKKQTALRVISRLGANRLGETALLARSFPGSPPAFCGKIFFMASRAATSTLEDGQ